MGPLSYMWSIDQSIVMQHMTVDGIECLVLSPVHFTAQERFPQHPFERQPGMWQDQYGCNTQMKNNHLL